MILLTPALPVLAADATWKVVQVGGDSNRLEFTLRTVDVERQTLADAAVVDPGLPDVPVLVRVLAGRNGWTAVIESVVPSVVAEEDAVIEPRALETVETVSDNEVKRVVRRDPRIMIYERDDFWPTSQAAISEAFMGTNKLVRLSAYPWQYNPVRHRLRHTDELRIRLKFVPDE